MVSVNGCPHGYVCGVFGGSHPYLRCNPSLNSYFLREKLYLFKSSTLSRFDAPFCDARCIVSFFSDEQFSIILAFIESVLFCLSVLLFLFIRVCSVPAISGSMFSNGSQMACDHS